MILDVGVGGALGASEELAEHALLHVVELPDARRQSLGQALVDGRVLRHLLHLLDALLRVLPSPLPAHCLLGPAAVGVGPARRARHVVFGRVLHEGRRLSLGLVAPRAEAEVYHVDVGLVHAPHDPLLGAHALRDRLENTRHLHAVARPHRVDEVVEAEEGHRLGGLALGDLVGRLLQPNHLLVREEAPVVHHLHRELGRAVLAARWLVDAPAVDHHLLLVAADSAAEVALLQVGYDRRHPRDHAGDGHQLVDVARVEVAQLVHVLQVERPHLGRVVGGQGGVGQGGVGSGRVGWVWSCGSWSWSTFSSAAHRAWVGG